VKTARFAPEALIELREAAAWYKERDPEVARRFLSAARSLAHVVARRPLRFPALLAPATEPPVRRALVPGFPWALVFVEGEHAIHIIAVAHQRREPGYWLHRFRLAR
jgi:plasmid stabilization system protein ParE